MHQSTATYRFVLGALTVTLHRISSTMETCLHISSRSSCDLIRVMSEVSNSVTVVADRLDDFPLFPLRFEAMLRAVRGVDRPLLRRPVDNLPVYGGVKNANF